MTHKWIENEILFLRENYPLFGGQYCSNKLNIPINRVYYKAHKLGLKLNSQCKSYIQQQNALKYNYPNINNFRSVKEKETAYILGILWADGYLNKNNIILEINNEDIQQIKPVFFKLGEWRVGHRIRKDRKKEVGSLSLSNKEIGDLLREYNYHNKTKDEPLVLKHIPKNLKKYFFRGLIDGDGNFYVSKNYKNFQFCLAGSYNQNWKYFTDLLDELQLTYYVKHIIRNENSKYSIVRITKKKDVIQFGEYIYENFLYDKIGFTRKFEKIQIMKLSNKK